MTGGDRFAEGCGVRAGLLVRLGAIGAMAVTGAELAAQASDGGARFVGSGERRLIGGTVSIGVDERRQRFSPVFQKTVPCPDVGRNIAICLEGSDWAASGGISFNRPAHFHKLDEEGDRRYRTRAIVNVIRTPDRKTFAPGDPALKALVQRFLVKAHSKTLSDRSELEGWVETDRESMRMASVAVRYRRGLTIWQVSVLAMAYRVVVIETFIVLSGDNVPQALTAKQRALHDGFLDRLRFGPGEDTK